MSCDAHEDGQEFQTKEDGQESQTSNLQSQVPIVKEPDLHQTLEDFRSQDPAVQLQAASTISSSLTSDASKIKKLVEAGAIPDMIKAVKSSDSNIAAAIIIALGNIAGSSSELRTLLMSEGAWSTILDRLQENTDHVFAVSAVRVVKKFFEDSLPPDDIKKMLPCLANCVHDTEDQTSKFALELLSIWSEGSVEVAKILTDLDIAGKMASVMEQTKLADDPAVKCWSLHILVSIIKLNGDYVKNIVAAGVLKWLPYLAGIDGWHKIKIDLFYLLSRVMDEGEEYVQKVIEAGLYCPMLYNLRHQKLKVCKMAVVAFKSFISGGSKEQMFLVVDCSLRYFLNAMLDSPHACMIVSAIEIMDILLPKTGDPMKTVLLTTITTKKLEELKSHEDLDVYDTVTKFWDTHMKDWVPCEEKFPGYPTIMPSQIMVYNLVSGEGLQPSFLPYIPPFQQFHDDGSLPKVVFGPPQGHGEPIMLPYGHPHPINPSQ